MKRILILGATSAIAEATARRFAERGDRLYLVGRRADALEAIANDLRVRGAQQVACHTADLVVSDTQAPLMDEAWRVLGSVDVALIAHGDLPDQALCAQDVDALRDAFETNALSAMTLLTRLANRFEVQGHGTLAAISSVAGERGRQSNYVYGAAKGALSLFLQGLDHRLSRHGVHVLTIKPGFVDTPMTASFPKGPLWATPDRVARDIVEAIDRKRSVLYTPGFWRWIMLIIRHVPRWLFIKTRL